MPICPRCSATIHPGAEDQCPACGYSLARANAIFGEGMVEFTRVVDAAGALTHPERLELLRALEHMERLIPPAALCIYITDDGRAAELRTHAHWILNHARIHHPSFGRRELRKAIEDAELRERRPGEQPAGTSERPPALPVRLWNSLCSAIHETLHPPAAPVRQEWMLILVVDVQLEMACFSWGYMLDAYINPDSINSCIISARLQFRERAMVAGLRKVMNAATRQIARSAHKTNRRLLLRSTRALLPAALLGTALLAPATAEPASAIDSLRNDDTAEEIAEPPAEPALPTAPDAATAVSTPSEPTSSSEAKDSPDTPAPSQDKSIPRWQPEHYRLLMAGELDTGYTALLAAPPAADKAAEKATKAVKGAKPTDATTESDTRILGRYCDAYLRPAPEATLIDPQHLLHSPEAEDITHLLRHLNDQARYRLCTALVKGSQVIPGELSAATLVGSVAQQSCDYAVLLLYPLGNTAAIDIGYRDIKLDDDTRHQWLQRVRSAAAESGDGVEGLAAALRTINELITPLSAGFTPLATDESRRIPRIDIRFKPKPEEDPSWKDKLRKSLENSWLFTPRGLAISLGIGGPLALLLVYLFFIRRRSATLCTTTPDTRLASPYGAGVSRYVRYLEGREAEREKQLF
ncbi:MAG: hypothetical protein ACI4P8_03100 [Akkermansia sp.]